MVAMGGERPCNLGGWSFRMKTNCLVDPGLFIFTMRCGSMWHDSVAQTDGGALNPSDAVCMWGIYNVCVRQNRVLRLVQDVVGAFRSNNLDVLGICGVGQHNSGFHGGAHFGTRSQKDFMAFVVSLANEELGDQGSHLLLVSGDIPSYAIIKRASSRFIIDRVKRPWNFDTRPGQMVVCECTWLECPITVGLCHCPSSKPCESVDKVRVFMAVSAVVGGSRENAERLSESTRTEARAQLVHRAQLGTEARAQPEPEHSWSGRFAEAGTDEYAG